MREAIALAVKSSPPVAAAKSDRSPIHIDNGWYGANFNTTFGKEEKKDPCFKGLEYFHRP
jgi:hypothetical protein